MLETKSSVQPPRQFLLYKESCFYLQTDKRILLLVSLKHQKKYVSFSASNIFIL